MVSCRTFPDASGPRSRQELRTLQQTTQTLSPQTLDSPKSISVALLRNITNKNLARIRPKAQTQKFGLQALGIRLRLDKLHFVQGALRVRGFGDWCMFPPQARFSFLPQVVFGRSFNLGRLPGISCIPMPRIAPQSAFAT